MNRVRQRRFQHYRDEYADHLVLRDVASARLAARRHALKVWDAREMPTQGHYVPAFLDLIESLERTKKIAPGKTILAETTTGTAGIALVEVASWLGYDVKIFIPADMPAPRLQNIRDKIHQSALSELSEMIETPAGEYVSGMVRQYKRYVARHRELNGKEVYPLNHSRSAVVVNTFYQLGLQMFAGDNPPDVAILALGNGTTSTGFGRALKSLNPRALVVGVEPIEAPCFQVKKIGSTAWRKRYGSPPAFRRHNLIGMGGWNVDFPNVDLSVIDHFATVRESEWRTAEAPFVLSEPVGHSSKACLATVDQWSELRAELPTTFFSLFYDPAWKY